MSCPLYCLLENHRLWRWLPEESTDGTDVPLIHPPYRGRIKPPALRVVVGLSAIRTPAAIASVADAGLPGMALTAYPPNHLLGFYRNISWSQIAVPVRVPLPGKGPANRLQTFILTYRRPNLIGVIQQVPFIFRLYHRQSAAGCKAVLRIPIQIFTPQ